MPTVFRVTLPVTDLDAAVRFYSSLFGTEGELLAPDLHGFRFAGATLALQQTYGAGHAHHGEPLYVAVEEPLSQVHYRAQSLGATHVDREIRTLPTGEYGFQVRDPFGNVLLVVDQRSVAWQPHAAASAARPATAAAEGDATLTLQRDFINAVKGGDLETVQELLGLDPELIEATDSVGVSALLHAAYKGHQPIVDLLLAQNHDLNLWEAAAFGRPDRIRFLLDHGFKVTVYSADGFTPLGLACFFGHVPCVKLLLERGADANAAAQNDMQVRPLHSALARAPEEAVVVNVRALIQARADVNATQQGGYTPLHQAADRGLVSAVKLLLSAGARPDARSAAGRTPADLARGKGHAAVVALLRP